MRLPEVVLRSVYLALLLIVALPTYGHQLKLFAAIEGGQIKAQAYFPGGGAARQIPVRLLDNQGVQLAELQTDEQGYALFSASADAALLTAKSGDGHLAEFRLLDGLPDTGSKETQANGAVTVTAETLDSIVARHVAPLRQQLQQYEEQRQWRDILGGLGYLLGLAGIGFYFSVRRSNKS
ncbi:MAG: hypothetical protein MI754_04145 [Chromatiales bacterium]|nr:hypothetical protein [Chromatiales bacterium]